MSSFGGGVGVGGQTITFLVADFADILEFSLESHERESTEDDELEEILTNRVSVFFDTGVSWTS